MDLSTRLKNFFTGRKPQQIQPQESFGNKLIRGIGSSPVGQAITGFQNFVQSPKPIQLPQVPNMINPSVKVGLRNSPYQFDVKPVQMVRDIVNEPLAGIANTASDTFQNIGRQIGYKLGNYDTPLQKYSNVKSPITKTMYNAGSVINPQLGQTLGVNNRPGEVLGNIGASAAIPLSLWGGGRILGTGKTAFNLAQKRVLSPILKQEIGKGISSGAAYGAASGLDQYRDEDVLGQLLGAGVNTALGGGIGAAGATAFTVPGYVLGRVNKNMQRLLKDQFKLSPENAEKAMKELVRNELGQFAPPQLRKETPTPPGFFNKMLDLRDDAPKPDTTYQVGEKYGKEYKGITPEMRMAFRKELKRMADELPKPGLSIKEVDSKNLPDVPLRDTTVSGQYTNDPNIDNPLLAKSQQLMREQGITPTNLPPDVPRVQDESVLAGLGDDFDQGRAAREQAGKKARGSLGLRLRTDTVDRLSPVFDLVKKAGKNLDAENDPYKQMRLLAGNTGKSEAFINKNVAPILKGKKNVKDDISKLWALEREGELVDDRGFVRKRSAEQIEQGKNELRAKYGDEGYKALQESTTKLRDVSDQLLGEMVEAGIVSEESATTIRSNNKFYAPFEAVTHMMDNMEKGLGGTGSFNVASQDVIKKIGDYEGAIADPIETLIRRVPKIINLIEKNKAMRTFVNLRNEMPDVYKELIQPVTGNNIPDGMKAVNVFENGQNKQYAVPDIVADAIKNLDAESGGLLVRLNSWQAKWLRTGATALNIGFIPVNIVRDVQDALTTELTENGAKAALQFLGNYPQAIFQAFKKGDKYQDWLAAGGASSSMTEQLFKNTPKTVNELVGKKEPFKVKQIPMNTLKSAKSVIEFVNRVGEQSTRLARYESGLKRGESKVQAAFKSRDVSLDFAKAGNSIKVLNQVVPFLNAGIQGSEKLMRLYKTNPKAAAATTSMMFGVPAVMLYAHNSQFADYEDIPDSERQDNWIILARDRTEEEKAERLSPIGFKIPKGFLAKPVATVAESALNFMKQQDGESLVSGMLDMAESISPIGLPISEDRLGRTISKVTPPGARAAIEWRTNKNLYFGSDIVPQSLENLPASEQYKDKTPGAYKVLGKATGFSPLKLENTVNTMLGGLGRQIATGLSGDIKGGTVDQISRRFMDIRDGKKADEAYRLADEEKQYTALRNKQLKEAFRNNDMQEFERLAEGMTGQQIKTLIRNDFEKQQEKKLTPEQKAFESLTKEEQRRLQSKRPELKTELDIIPEAGAAGEDPYSFESKIQESAQEAVVKSRVELSGKPETYNNTYYYINENGNSAEVSKDFSVDAPELTGETTLDKELRSDYQSEISTKQNNVVKLYKLGELTKEQAATELAKLEEARSGIKGGSGKGGKKGIAIDFRQFAKQLTSVKPVQVRVTRRSGSKAYTPPTVKAPTIKQLKFKGKELKLKKST
jgi:hypothetical protein